jgi:2,4-dienoyl-CoA reductase (NADPH2)
MAMDCAVNPFTGRETELSLRPAERPKNIVVIGGGPGGLEAARVAALRGHHVQLFERGAALGGALVAASMVHPENQPMLDWLIREVERQGVERHLGQAMTAETIRSLAPDAVIIATGGRLEAPRIEGDQQAHVWTGRSLRELLAGRLPEDAGETPAWLAPAVRASRPLQRFLQPSHLRRLSRIGLPFGRRVAIIGADLAALELAEFLAERRRVVSIFAAGRGLAPEVGGKRRGEHMQRLDRAGVSINLDMQIESIGLTDLVVSRTNARTRSVPADSVVIAGEIVADRALFDALEESSIERYAVGDCNGLGLIQGAVLDGARAACAI